MFENCAHEIDIDNNSLRNKTLNYITLSAESKRKVDGGATGIRAKSTSEFTYLSVA